MPKHDGEREAGRSMRIADSQQRRLVDQLRQADGRPIPFAELRAGGVDFPALVIAELELSGYCIERVREQGRMAGVRLLTPGPAETPRPGPLVPTNWPGATGPRRDVRPAI